MSKGFTLIELLVVVSIIVLMTALTLPSQRAGDNQLALQRSAYRLAQSLRMAQEYAVSAREFDGDVPNGYGVYFNINQPDSYVLFADADGDQAYSGINERVEEIALETNVILSQLSPMAQSSLTILFIPPDPTIIFSPDASLSKITIKAQKAEGLVSQYTYRSAFWGWDWISPRASCDTTDYSTECPSPFSALESDPQFVFDWFAIGPIHLHEGFEKQTSQVISGLEKSVQVNKAGLIFVE